MLVWRGAKPAHKECRSRSAFRISERLTPKALRETKSAIRAASAPMSEATPSVTDSGERSIESGHG